MSPQLRIEQCAGAVDQAEALFQALHVRLRALARRASGRCRPAWESVPTRLSSRLCQFGSLNSLSYSSWVPAVRIQMPMPKESQIGHFCFWALVKQYFFGCLQSIQRVPHFLWATNRSGKPVW